MVVLLHWSAKFCENKKESFEFLLLLPLRDRIPNFRKFGFIKLEENALQIDGQWLDKWTGLKS